jgi:DNA-binding response OmpR family regulator
MSRILLVDDDYDLVDILEVGLRRAGYLVAHAYDAASAHEHLHDTPPDLIVLDVDLGGASGFEVLKELRRATDVPVLLLTARTSEDDKVMGLDLGADDYLTKPFGYRELLARIRSRLRPRSQPGVAHACDAGVLRVGPLTLDVPHHEIRREGRPIVVTATEFRLLRCLMLNADTVVPTLTLLKEVWGENDAGAADVLRVALHRLRRKVEADPAHPTLIRTVPGVGLRFAPTLASEAM